MAGTCITNDNLCFQSDDEDTFKVSGDRSQNKNLHLSDLELSDSDESSGISVENGLDVDYKKGIEMFSQL